MAKKERIRINETFEGAGKYKHLVAVAFDTESVHFWNGGNCSPLKLEEARLVIGLLQQAVDCVDEYNNDK